MNKGFLDFLPKEWGKRYESSDAVASWFSLEPNSHGFVANMNYFIVFYGHQPGRKKSLNSDRRIVGFNPVGGLEIIPQNSDFFSIWTAHKDSMVLGLTSKKMASLAGLEHGNESFELLQPGFGIADQRAYLLSQQMRNEIFSENMGYGESLDALLTIFGIHILRNYSNLGRKEKKIARGGISPIGWRRVDEYISAHLSENISLEKMAEVALLSPSHFSRAFKETVGQSPHQYIMRRRLSISKELLLKTDSSFAEIAKISGFASHSHMTATMRKVWGVTPMQARRELRN